MRISDWCSDVCSSDLVALLAGCGEPSKTNETSEPAAASAAADYERGPHRGRMLRDGDFAVEVTIFADGVDPDFQVYASRNDKPVAPGAVTLYIAQKGSASGRDKRCQYV